MFTFGREHEKRCDSKYVRNPSQVVLLLNVIDAVHDLLEDKGSEDHLVHALRVAMTDGGAGVWENAAKWLRLSSGDYPQVLKLWPELAQHPKADVRFKVACFLDEMPRGIFAELSSQLTQDKSSKVATMANARMDERNERSRS
ncbi:hypothetical protein [Undibacterium sp. TJN19]|uniref:hypothetical protein n=1 Tax=Undibacterium sp. TJN19 TaxID=3413055 RepID=UPI003BF010D9